MSKISAYTELAEAPASTDEFVIVDKSDTSMAATGTTKKIQAQYITIADASETVKGKVELATNAETITGTDTVRAVTPANITAKMDTDGTLAGNSDTRIPTQKAVKTYVDANGGGFNQGFMNNGKIVVTDTGSGINIAIKTLAGTDPSSSSPVKIRIGDTVRSITSALSVTKADGTNWMNAGSSELATKEIDYFVYLGYNATDGVTIGFSRIPYANQYSDFSATTTNEKYCAISTITNAASTDYYENIGRFAATLSAGAGYTWSVPAYTAANLIQRPIYETRVLSYLPTYTGWSSLTTVITYQVRGRMVRIFNVPISGTSNSAAAQMTLPFTVPTGTPTDFQLVYVSDNGVASTTPGRSYITGNSNTLIWGKASTSDGGFTASGTKTTYIGNFEFSL